MNLVHLIDVEKLTSQLTKISLPKAATALAASFLLATGVTLYSGYLLISQREAVPMTANDRTALPSMAQNDGNRSRETLTPAETEKILKRNIFNSEGKLGDASDEETQPLEKTVKPVKSDLPLKLLGVIFGGTPYNGLALIENKEKNRTNSFVVGEVVERGANLIEIYPDRIILDRQGRKEYILIETTELVRSRRTRKASANRNTSVLASGNTGDTFKEEGFERKGGEITMSEAYKRNLLTDKMTDVLQDAKAEPNMVGGELHGFRLVRIRDNSVYQKAGFQNGDVVLEINGIPLKDAAGAVQLLNSLRQAKQIDVLVDRNGSTSQKNITVQ